MERSDIRDTVANIVSNVFMNTITTNELKMRGINILEEELAEIKKEIAEGKFIKESVAKHIKRVKKMTDKIN